MAESYLFHLFNENKTDLHHKYFISPVFEYQHPLLLDISMLALV